MPKKIKQNSFEMPLVRTKEQKLSFWKKNIEWGIKFAEDKFTKNAERWLNYFKGIHWPDQNALSRDSRLVINYCYSITKSIAPQIYFQDPYFYVTAKKQQYAKGAPVAEDVLNNTWTAPSFGAKSHIRRIVNDQLVMSFGAIKQGYQTKFVRDYEQPNLETGQPYSEFIEEQSPWMLRVSPRDIIFDPEAKNFSERRWHAIKYLLPVYEAKRIYDNLSDVDEASFGRFSTEFDSIKLSVVGGEKQMFERIEIWEVQDLVDNMFYWISKDVDKFLGIEDNEYDFHSNLTLFSPNDVPDELYPLSEISQIADLNWELDQVRTQMMNHRKKMQRKIIAEDGCFTSSTERKKFLSGEDLQMIVVSDGSISKRRIMVMDASGISPDFYSYGNQIIQDINNTTANGANQRATEDFSEKTATEASIIDKNAGIRNSERLDYMADFICDIARKHLKILQKYVKSEEFYSEKRQAWLVWARENIAGDYNVHIHTGATARRSEEQERAMLNQVLPTLITAARPDGTPVSDNAELFRYLFSKYGMTEDEIKRIIPPQSMQPPPVPQPQPQEATLPPEALIQQLLGGQQAPPNPYLNAGGMMI
jgi:hypothetical protein